MSISFGIRLNEAGGSLLPAAIYFFGRPQFVEPRKKYPLSERERDFDDQTHVAMSLITSFTTEVRTPSNVKPTKTVFVLLLDFE